MRPSYHPPCLQIKRVSAYSAKNLQRESFVGRSCGKNVKKVDYWREAMNPLDFRGLRRHGHRNGIALQEQNVKKTEFFCKFMV